MIRALFFFSIYFAFSFESFGDSKKSSDNNTPYVYGTVPAKSNPEEALAHYDLWKKNFLAKEGADIRVKWVNPEQTTSEGIGWGMLLAVYANDLETFEGLWNYYLAHSNVQGLMHAKTDVTHGIISYNALSSADFDACLALITATKQWPEKASVYHNAASSLLKAIRNHEVDSTNYTIKNTDQAAYNTGINIAYCSPAHFRVFGEFSNDAEFWNQVADNCYSIISKNLASNNASGGLVSDRTDVSGKNITDDYAFGSGKTYYYDAARVPFKIALDYLWNGNLQARDYLNRCNDFVLTSLGGPENIVDGYTQNGTATGSCHNSSFVGPFACAATTGYDIMYLDAIYSDLLATQDDYSFYSQSVKTLCLFVLTGLFKQPVESSKYRSKAPMHTVSEHEYNSQLIAPNPFCDQTMLNLPPEEEIYPLAYQITDEQGFVYESSEINSPSQMIGAGLPSGIYLVQITYLDKMRVARLYKK